MKALTTRKRNRRFSVAGDIETSPNSSILSAVSPGGYATRNDCPCNAGNDEQWTLGASSVIRCAGITHADERTDTDQEDRQATLDLAGFGRRHLRMWLFSEGGTCLQCVLFELVGDGLWPLFTREEFSGMSALDGCCDGLLATELNRKPALSS